MDEQITSWSSVLIDQLVSSGVRNFCIAPGSRSTSLVDAAEKNPLAHTIVHYDERGVAFYALGLAKALSTPVAIITTSGSALGNCMPAAQEAFHSQIPLLLLTADRPPELQDAGENQTCSQKMFFGNYTQWETTIPPYDPTIDSSYIASLASYAVYRAVSPSKGPIHINCMAREPFFQDSCTLPSKPKKHFFGTSHLPDEDVENLADTVKRYSRGVILVGEYSEPELSEYIPMLARKTGWPILSCISSPLRAHASSWHVEYAELLTHILPFKDVQCVLQIGSKIVSKNVPSALQGAPVEEWMLFSETTMRMDQNLAVSTQVHATLTPTIQTLVQKLRNPQSTTWMNQWSKTRSFVETTLSDFFSDHATLSEYSVFHILSSVAQKDYAFFFGNSLSIRCADMLFFPRKDQRIHSSRGVSGIDGQIATIAGIARGLNTPLVAVIGDQTFLHDVNSLPLIQSSPVPILLFVLNNGGGNIFSHLPINNYPRLFERYFLNPHSQSLHSLASAFSCPTKNTNSNSGILDALQIFQEKSESIVVEVSIEPGTSVKQYEALHALFSKKMQPI